MKERERERKEEEGKKGGTGRRPGERKEERRNLGMLIWQKMWGRREGSVHSSPAV